MLVQASGANQASHYALIRALAAGTPVIDRWHEETPDTSFHRGSFYSVKAPGLAFEALPFYAAADAAGLIGSVRRAGERIADRETPDAAGRRAAAVRAQRGETWLLGLWAVVLPAALLLWLVRSLAERAVPGRGTLAAVALGAGTLVLPYATMLYAHVLAATLVFAAFALLWRERERPPRIGLVAVSGLMAGLAAVVEYPAALAGAIVGVFALARVDARRPPRALAYAVGALAGAAPLALYNIWAFGSVTHLSYDDAVAVEGRSGHDVLGLNDEGLFGVGLPDPRALLDLLLAPKGLLTLTPVVVMALAGIVALHRAGRRAEAWAIGGVAGVTLLYNAGYYLPYGGDVPGPRFLLVALPFLAIGLGEAVRRWPGPALALGAASILGMVVATATDPQLRGHDTGHWVALVADGDFQFTLAGALGIGHGWIGLLAFLGLTAGAVALALIDARLPRLSREQRRQGLLALASWAAVALVVAPLLAARSADGAALVLAGAATGCMALLAAARGRGAAP